ncbi:response regulator [Spirosoma fluviale]|nr:response regulator [Spirosoma fluviale]
MALPSFESLQSPSDVVCLVDDDADYRLLVEIVFKRYMPSYSLRLFTSGQNFLDALKKQPHYRSLPVVMMSADASHSEITSFYEAGAISYLSKQADVNRLKDTLLLACQHANKRG